MEDKKTKELLSDLRYAIAAEQTASMEYIKTTIELERVLQERRKQTSEIVTKIEKALRGEM